MQHTAENLPVRDILDRLKKHQFKTYIVGGAVRDAMLNKTPQDIDLLTCATPDQICGLFGDQKVKVAGKAFPTCLVNSIEISSARSCDENFPRSDLAMRDFTFNAMACDPDNKKIIDPFDGREDLKKGLVRFTRDPEKRIKEDPVRMIRACRFLAMIKGQMSDSSFDAIVTFKDLLDETVAKERIQNEIKKAMGLDQPSLFFEALFQMQLLEKIFPSLDLCHGLDGGPYHGETVFEHCMLVGDALPASMPMLRLAGFLHDTGKFDAAKIKAGRLTFAGHEKKFHRSIAELENLRFSVKEVKYIKALIQSHMRPLTDESTPKAVRKLLMMLDGHGLEYQDFMRMRIADRRGNLAKLPYTISQIRERLQKIFDEINSPHAFTIDDLKLSGKDIIRIMNLDPGPQVGAVKKQLFEKVLEDPSLNNKNDLEQICFSLKIKN